MPKPRILITLGDPAGIGSEVIDKALASGRLPSGFDFEIIGDRRQGIPGKPNAASAQESLRALLLAGERLRDESDVAAVVTGPVSKAQLESVGFPFPGQTEYFAKLLGAESYGMCLSGSSLTVGLASIHLSLREAVGTLNKESIVSIGCLLADFVERRFGSSSQIAVCGLNPHAGEEGKFGDEESRIIQPAIDELNSRFPSVFSGPHVPDAVFRDAASGRYQAVLAMYHDQGLIPLKLLDFDSAVNITLGLPKPRTSPDHGTAFDIAGKGIARADSMIHAIRLACELA